MKENDDFTKMEWIVWDSGMVNSDQSNFIPYDGDEIKPKTRYYYRIKIWDNQGRVSNFSKPSYFETGP